MWIPRNSFYRRFFFLGTANSGLTVNFQISKDGAAFTNSNTGFTTLSDDGDGYYHFDLDNTDTNTLGTLWYKLTGATLDNMEQIGDQVAENDGGRWQVGVKSIDNNVIGPTTLVDGLLTTPKFADDAITAAKVSTACKLSFFTDPTLPQSYPALGTAPKPGEALMALLQLASNITISGTTLTVFALDGTTPIMSFTLNSATTPTARTRAT